MDLYFLLLLCNLMCNSLKVCSQTYHHIHMNALRYFVGLIYFTCRKSWFVFILLNEDFLCFLFPWQAFHEDSIISGYRHPRSSATDCVLSLFQLTNETLNVWTHFLPTWYVISRACFLSMYAYRPLFATFSVWLLQ